MSNSGKVISTVVKLDGVEAVRKSFEALGKAGASAFTAIRNAADKIGPGLGGKLDALVTRLKAGLKEIGANARNIATQFGKLRIATSRLGGEFAGVAARIGIIGGAIVGAGAGFIAFTKNAADNADAVGKSAEALGLSVKSYQALEFAANQANVSSEDFGSGIARLNKLIGASLSGNKAATKALLDAGVAYKKANGQIVVPKNVHESFLRLADSISKIDDPAKRAAILTAVLGKSYAKFIPLLSGGRKEIQATADQFSKSGLGFTGDETKKADAFGDSLDLLFKTMGRLRDKAFLKFAEPLTKAFETATNYIIAHADDILKAIQNIADQVGPLFDDVINALTGNDKDVKAQWILDLRDGLKSIGESAQKAFYEIILPAFTGVRDGAQTVADKVNSIFGTKITGDSLLLAGAFLKLSGAFGILGPAITAISAAFGVLSSIIGPLIIGLGAALGLPAIVVAAIIAAIAGAAVLIYAYWDDIVAYAGQAWDLIKEYTSIAWEGIKGVVSAGIDGVNALWKKATDYFSEIWTVATDYVNAGIESVKNAISGVISRVKDAIASIKAMFSAENNQGAKANYLKKAGGGYIRGPGTGTSDSIPAYLSNGEFVIRAAAVRKYGAQLFASLNGLRLSPNAIGRFAMGGLVGLPAAPMAALPAAAGGPSSSLTLVLDGQSFGGLTGSPDTIKSLERAVRAQRIRAAGLPNRYDR